MRESSPSLRSRAKLALSSLLLAAQTTFAFNFQPVPSPNLNLQKLGRVAFAGDFDSISLYQFQGQNEQSSTTTNGAILARYPNGVFATLNQTDGDIRSMCPLVQNGKVQGIVFGGNFTSVANTHTPGGIAVLNPNDGTVNPLLGLNGSVNALYCDKDAGRVYVGGSFTGGSGTSNAAVWTSDWVGLPFSGFNGPVHSITKASTGKIIFGGEFNGLGTNNASAPRQNNTQILPIASANLTAQTSSGRPGLTEPKNIVCKSGDGEGPNNTWLLADGVPGFWRADFGFGFEPSMIRLFNTKFEGRGTKTWRFTALPDGGIMNLSYVDPTNGQKKFCDSQCPLPQGNVSGQDFTFVNNVGMNAFRIDISEFYGAGGGLDGIELFQNEIYTFAVNEFNEPKCGGVKTGATATTTGPWALTPSHGSNSQYLSTTLQGGNIDPEQAVVVFQPDVPQSGNYSVTVFTPGCIGDGTCGTRGRVNLTGSMSKSTRTGVQPTPVEIFQTNNFDKYDTIWTGYVDATDGFRPSVTLRPMPGQNGPLTVVAQRVRFNLLNGTNNNLNGLFEYDPNQKEVDQNFANSVIDSAGASLTPADSAAIRTLASVGDGVFVGGNFSGNGFNNMFAIHDKATALPGDGLNGQVMAMYPNGSTIYVGGEFTNTHNNDNNALSHVAAYDTDKKQWQPLGGGVNGIVMYIVPFTLNITAKTPETVIAISGFFTQVNSFGNNSSFPVENFAIWVPSRSNWLHNLNINSISIQGSLTAFTDIPGANPLFAGSVSSQAVGASGAVALESGNPLSLEPFAANILPQTNQAPLSKRAVPADRNDTTTGIVTATFYKENGMNKTILAGHFAAKGTDNSNITNLLIIDGKDSDRVTGFHDELDSNSTFVALGVLNNILYAGGKVSGNVKNSKVAGVLTYDLGAGDYTGAQPPSLQGTNVTVNAIAARPKSQDIYIAGDFESAGALACPSLCIWSSQRNQWVSPGGDLRGVVSSMVWIADTKLLLAGNLTAGNNQTKIVTYDSTLSQFKEFDGARALPGPVTAITVATSDGSQIWASGQASDGTPFLSRFDGQKWNSVDKTMFGQGTTVRGIQALTLSQNHGQSGMIDQNQDLLILGNINVTNFGSASGVLFNGTTLQPLILSSGQNGPGSLSQVFVENPEYFLRNSGKHLALGFIVLIALAIALAITFLLVVVGIIVEWYRKKSRGYMPAPTTYPDRSANMNKVRPDQLFGTLPQRSPAPAI